MHSNDNLHFHPVDNEQIIAYSKATDELDNVILTVVNLDPHHVQSGWVNLDLDQLDIDSKTPYQVHDLLTGARYLWQGTAQFRGVKSRLCPGAHFPGPPSGALGKRL